MGMGKIGDVKDGILSVAIRLGLIVMKSFTRTAKGARWRDGNATGHVHLAFRLR